MTVTALPNYIGSVISIAAASPANANKAGYEALTWAVIGNIVSHGALGVTSADVSVSTLAGYVRHSNGSKDLGEIAITAVIDATDAGQVIVLAGSNGNTVHSIKIADPDGKHHYYQGVVANAQQAERNDTSYKGLSFVIRGDAATVLLNQTAPA